MVTLRKTEFFTLKSQEKSARTVVVA